MLHGVDILEQIITVVSPKLPSDNANLRTRMGEGTFLTIN